MSANNRRRLTAAYWAGREGSTVRAYESAFRILRFICIEEDLNLGKLDEPARCLIMMRLEEMGKKEGTLKMVLAVIALIREAMGLEANEGTRIEKNVKKGIIKKMNSLAKKRKRKPAQKRDVEILWTEVMRGLKEPLKLMVAVVFIICYLAVRRFSDINRLLVKDMEVQEGGVLFYMPRSKNDKWSEGREFFISGEKDGRFSFIELMKNYVKRMGLKKEDHLFPKPGKGGKCLKQKCLEYSAAFRGLAALKDEFGLDSKVSLHSPRIGGATRSAELGVSRNVIKKAGMWRSEVVDTYMCVDKPAELVSKALLEEF